MLFLQKFKTNKNSESGVGVGVGSVIPLSKLWGGGGGRRTIAHSILLCMWKQLTLIEKKSRNEHCQKRWQNSHPRPLPPSVIRACTVSNVLTEPSLASRPTLAHTCVVTIQWFLLSVMDGEGHARLWWYDR